MGLKNLFSKLIDSYLESEDSKLIRVRKHRGLLELKGFYAEKRVGLYGIEITRDKICKTYGWNPEEVYFSWGDADHIGEFYLACAILLEVYNKDRAYDLAERFQKDFIRYLPGDDFDKSFNIQIWYNNKVPHKNRGKLVDKEGNIQEYQDDD